MAEQEKPAVPTQTVAPQAKMYNDVPLPNPNQNPNPMKGGRRVKPQYVDPFLPNSK